MHYAQFSQNATHCNLVTEVHGEDGDAHDDDLDSHFGHAYRNYNADDEYNDEDVDKGVDSDDNDDGNNDDGD
ncbi:hypothetical protein DPMN_032513 [Dreissena polymorpha]|uniref:Uncharacterized protein n=1 Tax=Dreissena polymorpha TaxID=45954 RepID=A0A9D4M3W5_DREPO|nr:hypothetical protein DPMN_032513 [Dreissena polymorpha]